MPPPSLTPGAAITLIINDGDAGNDPGITLLPADTAGLTTLAQLVDVLNDALADVSTSDVLKRILTARN